MSDFQETGSNTGARPSFTYSIGNWDADTNTLELDATFIADWPSDENMDLYADLDVELPAQSSFDTSTSGTPEVSMYNPFLTSSSPLVDNGDRMFVAMNCNNPHEDFGGSHADPALHVYRASTPAQIPCQTLPSYRLGRDETSQTPHAQSAGCHPPCTTNYGFQSSSWHTGPENPIEIKSIVDWKSTLLPEMAQTFQTIRDHAKSTAAKHECHDETLPVTTPRKRYKKNANSWMCPYEGCGQRYDRKCDLNKHIKRRHSKGSHPCSECEKSFHDKKDRNRHILSKHSSTSAGRDLLAEMAEKSRVSSETQPSWAYDLHNEFQGVFESKRLLSLDNADVSSARPRVPTDENLLESLRSVSAVQPVSPATSHSKHLIRPTPPSEESRPQSGIDRVTRVLSTTSAEIPSQLDELGGVSFVDDTYSSFDLGTVMPLFNTLSRTLSQMDPDGVDLAFDTRKRRCVSHNVVERRRRDNINERIANLTKLVPAHRLDEAKVDEHLDSWQPQDACVHCPCAPRLGSCSDEDEVMERARTKAAADCLETTGLVDQRLSFGRPDLSEGVKLPAQAAVRLVDYDQWLGSSLASCSNPLTPMNLSLDDGGFRGYSLPFEAQGLVHEARQLSEVGNRKDSLPEELLPSHYFDLLLGSSAGGLIAIMLGRLRMSVNEVLSIYREVRVKLFGNPGRDMALRPLPYREDLQMRVRALVRNCVRWTELLRTTVEPAHGQDTSSSSRSWYKRLNVDTEEADLSIWQAAQATSAAPSYFSMFEDGSTQAYTDGGLRYSNPSTLPSWSWSAPNPIPGLKLSVEKGRAEILAYTGSQRRAALARAAECSPASRSLSEKLALDIRTTLTARANQKARGHLSIRLRLRLRFHYHSSDARNCGI